MDDMLPVSEEAWAKHKTNESNMFVPLGARVKSKNSLPRRPRLLMLDEPATGLDPAGMRDMRALIRRLADEGITVLLSSHQLPEVQDLCDRVAIVDSGRVVYEGALADLRRQGGAGYRLHTTDDLRALAVVRAQPRHRARDRRRARVELPSAGVRRGRSLAGSRPGRHRGPRAHP